MKEMTNAQFDSFLETLAKLVESAENVKEAAKMIRDAKTQKEADTVQK